jgi:hypothetical protein
LISAASGPCSSLSICQRGRTFRSRSRPGQVWISANCDRVYNRVSFPDLKGGTVVKDKRFSPLKPVVFRGYGPQNVLPVLPARCRNTWADLGAPPQTPAGS